MTTENIPNLPINCCAKCGFLYGLAANPANLDDAVFDPDRIRDSSYPPDFGKRPGIITTLPHASQEYSFRPDSDGHSGKTEPEPIEIRELGWADTVAICCYKNQYPKFYVEREPFTDPSIHYRQFTSLFSPKNKGNILSNIRNERNDCPGFFEYHPGYTPEQHIQLELDERRTQRQEEHERSMVQYHAEQEKRLSQSFKNQEEQQHKQVLMVAIAGVVIAIVVAVVQPLVEYFLPFIFGPKPTP